MISTALFYNKDYRKYRREYLRENDRCPYSVNMEQERKCEHDNRLKHKCSQKRDERGYKTVIKRGEESRAENRNSREQE